MPLPLLTSALRFEKLQVANFGSPPRPFMIPPELQNTDTQQSVIQITPILNPDIPLSPARISTPESQYNSTTIATNVAASPFENSLSRASLPPPGPSYYAARRALWLTPIPGLPLPPVPSTSRDRLEQLLNVPGAVENEEVWRAGVEKVWKGLVAGGRLKRRLPMNIVVCKADGMSLAGSYSCRRLTIADQNYSRWVVTRSRNLAAWCRCARARRRPNRTADLPIHF